jgi:hypothetical protein
MYLTIFPTAYIFRDSPGGGVNCPPPPLLGRRVTNLRLLIQNLILDFRKVTIGGIRSLRANILPHFLYLSGLDET